MDDGWIEKGSMDGGRMDGWRNDVSVGKGWIMDGWTDLVGIFVYMCIDM